MVIVVFFGFSIFAGAEGKVERFDNPSVLIITGRNYAPHIAGDFDYFKELNKKGFQIDIHYMDEKNRPLNWELIKNYNCLVFLDIPPEEEVVNNASYWDTTFLWKASPPYKKEMQVLLDKYLALGGGIFFMPDIQSYAAVLKQIYNFNTYLEKWGAKLPLESIHDVQTETKHPRNTIIFIYSEKISSSPVSEGVKGIWFPVGPVSGWSFQIPGQPIDVSSDWIKVVEGSNTSFSKDHVVSAKSIEENLLPLMYHRQNQNTPPTLYAIREVGEGRLALTVCWPIFTIYGGLSWVHDGVMLNKGISDKPSYFGKLFENTLFWLCEPSLKNGKLGGYIQDPLKLIHPNMRKKPDEFFSQFESYQNLTLPGNIYKGLIGARTIYSGGKGSVKDYAEVAKKGGLDFIIFLEEFSKLTEEKYRKLEEDCKKYSSDTLFLLPGFTFKNNIGNNMFAYGFDIKWPTKTQFVGKDNDELRHQCFDANGELYYSDEDAKNWLWQFVGVSKKNVGYYNFSSGKGMPVRDLRLFGILGVVTYIGGKMIEHITGEYLTYAKDGNPPLVCAVDIVNSPEELINAIQEKHYLTYVSTNSLQDLPVVMSYGHQYGRANVYFSAGPEIKSWAGTQRIMTYAGESFVPSRYRVRPLLWVTSDIGLKEIKIYCEEKPYRRFLLNGEKEFKKVFEWAYDRQRTLIAEIIDSKGNKAISAGFEIWCDANFHQWCGDRQNGEIWHGGGLGIPGPRRPYFNVGPTWDGGPPMPGYAEYYIGPAIKLKTGEIEGASRRYGGRPMEGDVWLTCFDESVANVAAFADHNFAKGVVANSYHTLGPIFPSEYMDFSLRRTQYLQRISGVSKEWHPMWPDRAGGNMALIEGEIILKKDVELTDMDILSMEPVNFPKDKTNVPIFAIRKSNEEEAICGTLPSIFDRYKGIPRGLGIKEEYDYSVEPGGYVAMFPSEEGISSVVFNVSNGTIKLRPWGRLSFYLPLPEREIKKGEKFSWQYLVLMDSIDQPAKNLHRYERIRQYLGLDRKNTCGIIIKKGKLINHFGLIDISPENGIVEFEIPKPDFEFNFPLGLRFFGFNPNWTIGQFQISGYSPGFYTYGKNVYRNLGPDDKNIVYLAIYPDFVPNTHCVVGHPVVCDNPSLIIEFTQLSTKPNQYHIAINNPTDQSIKTVLKKNMNLPDFEFPDTEVEVPAGGYIVVKEK